jgi:hypothetical protein
MPLVPCPECGHQVSTQALSCPSCGRMLLSAAAAQASGIFTPGLPPHAPEQVLWEGHPSFLLMIGRVLRFGLALVLWPLAGYVFVAYAVPLLARFIAPLRGWLRDDSSLTLVVAIAVGVILFAKGIGMLLVLARVKATHYRVTNQRILVETGLLSKALEEIDLRYVEDLEFQQTFLERIVSIGRILIISSDKLAPKMVLRGIRDPRGLRELIRSYAYHMSQRQLFTRAT